MWAMVLTRSMAKKRRAPLKLPHDILVEIAGHIAASSPRPMEDICSLRATCQPTRAACKEGAVAHRVALEREHAMRWFEHDRYLALVRNLAGGGNPEACFVLGLALVFTQGRAGLGTEWLKRAAVAGHKAAAYVLGVLCYRNMETRGDAKQFIRHVEGEMAPDSGGGHVHGCSKAAKTANRECMRWREEAVHAVREVTWKVARVPVPVPVVPPEDEDDGQHCEGSGCGVLEGWSGCVIFCSEGCRIRHEYSQFFSRVSLPVS